MMYLLGGSTDSGTHAAVSDGQHNLWQEENNFKATTHLLPTLS
jgi:hypothetical protein